MPGNQKNERTEYFAVFGLLNSVQALKLKKFILAQKGVVSAGVNFASENAFVRYNTESARFENIIDAIKKFGVSLEVENEATKDLINRRRAAEFAATKYELIFGAILTLPLLIVMFLKWFDIDLPIFRSLNKPIIQLILASPVVFWLGLKQIFAAIKSPLSFSTLIVFGSFGAFFLSVFHGIFGQNTYLLYFDTAALILIAVHFSKFLEMRTKRKIAVEITKILKSPEKTATIISGDDKEELIDIERICEDDILAVKNGEQIAADGIIISGTSSIDEQMITGASIPVDKFVGDKVYAGTINKTSPITISVTAVGDYTESARIIRMVEKAQMAKVPTLQRAEKFMEYFVISVFVLTLIVAAINTILGESILNVILISIGILVISCACALGLAISSANMVATNIGIKYGVLLRTGSVFEILGKIKILVLGKTKTVTSGRLSVSELKPFGSIVLKDLYDILLSLSSVSSHPFTKAINEYCQEHGGVLFPCNNYELSSGGVKCTIKGSVYSVGTYEYCEKLGGKVASVKPECFLFESSGEVPNILMKDGEVIALLSFAEAIRETAQQAISDFRKAGIEVYMFTQDSKKSASRIANLVGIAPEKIAAELKPEDKADTITAIMENEKALAMVGSGVSDAVALSNAPISISMGAVDAVVDASDIIIKNDDLSSVSQAIGISRKTTQITNQNLVLACVFNVIGIPFAIIGVLDPAIASLAIVISSTCVVANSFRLENNKF